jgi:hypothetical protein
LGCLNRRSCGSRYGSRTALSGVTFSARGRTDGVHQPAQEYPVCAVVVAALQGDPVIAHRCPTERGSQTDPPCETGVAEFVGRHNGAATLMEGSCRARHPHWRRFAWEAPSAASGNSEVLRVTRRLCRRSVTPFRTFPHASAEMPRGRAGIPAALLEARIARPHDGHKQLLHRIRKAAALVGAADGIHLVVSDTGQGVDLEAARARRGLGIALCCCCA